METQIIQVPYDSGRKNVGMGKGPAHFVRHGLDSLPKVRVACVEVEELPSELGTTFRVLSSLTEYVRAAVESNRFPLVLAGNCITAVGTLAGLSTESAIVWLDAHADFNTPETTVTGFVDGMALAMATGHCWQNLTGSIRGFRAVLDKNVVLIGARDLDPEERTLLERSAITSLDTTAIRKRGVKGALSPALEDLAAGQVYLHIDLDVLDATEATVNQYSSTGGLTLAELLEAVRVVAEARPIAAAAITAYDPLHDKDASALRAGAALIQELVTAGRQSFARAPG